MLTMYVIQIDEGFFVMLKQVLGDLHHSWKYATEAKAEADAGSIRWAPQARVRRIHRTQLGAAWQLVD